MPSCLILNGHPFTPSFSGAVAEDYARIVRSRGIEVRLLNLSALDVPDLLHRKPGDAEMQGDIARFWQDMNWADHVVIVHPLWWGSMPAKLKALFDIGLQSGKAYRYEDKRPLPLGLLKGRTARLIVTSDTPGWFMALAYGNAHFRLVKNQILKFIGLEPVGVTHLSVMRGSSPEKRAALLDKAARAAGHDAKKLLARTRAGLPTPQKA